MFVWPKIICCTDMDAIFPMTVTTIAMIKKKRQNGRVFLVHTL